MRSATPGESVARDASDRIQTELGAQVGDRGGGFGVDRPADAVCVCVCVCARAFVWMGYREGPSVVHRPDVPGVEVRRACIARHDKRTTCARGHIVLVIQLTPSLCFAEGEGRMTEKWRGRGDAGRLPVSRRCSGPPTAPDENPRTEANPSAVVGSSTEWREERSQRRRTRRTRRPRRTRKTRMAAMQWKRKTWP